MALSPGSLCSSLQNFLLFFEHSTGCVLLSFLPGTLSLHMATELTPHCLQGSVPSAPYLRVCLISLYKEKLKKKKKTTKQTQNYLLDSGPLVLQASPAR